MAADWLNRPRPPRRGRLGRHGGVQGHGRVGVDDAQRRRADHAHAVGPGLPDQLALPGQAAFAVVRVPGGGDHDRP